MRHGVRPLLLVVVLSVGPMAGCVGGGEAPETRTVTSRITAIEPGQERTVCQVLDLGNEAPAVVRSIRTSLTLGSHHMILYRTDAEATDTPQPCGSFPLGDDTLFIAQQSDTALDYPDGAALPIQAHQHVRVEIHYINYTEEPIDVEGSVHFDLVPPDPSLAPVGLLFTGLPVLQIPPRSAHEVHSFHAIPSDWRVFGLTSHTHQLGEHALLRRATGVSDPDAELLHESFDWAEPPLDIFEPPLGFEGDEGLWLTCKYYNPHDHYVTFGSGFEDEMCFLWAYYY
jgi:hypothetical protein